MGILFRKSKYPQVGSGRISINGILKEGGPARPLRIPEWKYNRPDLRICGFPKESLIYRGMTEVASFLKK